MCLENNLIAFRETNMNRLVSGHFSPKIQNQSENKQTEDGK